MRGIIDKNGEQFAYVLGNVVYTLDDEPTGRLEDDFVLDLAGNRMWRVVGDAIYSLDGTETIGFLGGAAPDV
jgi:hypothetical protein